MPKKKSKSKGSAQLAHNHNNDELIQVDPSRVRFQHSRIRPHFSGCGRSVVATLDSIRNGEMTSNDLPPIQVRIFVFMTSMGLITASLISY